jgi:hypothetical protein
MLKIMKNINWLPDMAIALWYRNNPENWTLLTETPIPELSYQDNSWNSIPDDIYRWAVRSVYTNNITIKSSLF